VSTHTSDFDPDEQPFPELDERLLTSLITLSRAMRVADGDLSETLLAILALACRMVPGAEGAGLNLIVRDKFQPQAVLGDEPHALDMFQQSTGAGPCIDASRDQTIIEIVDTRAEERWPGFGPRAYELGVLSMFCVPLWVDDVRLGSLSLYGMKPSAFDQQTRNVAELLATHGALALSDAQRAAHLRRALINRDTIGQAKGILMERHRITPDEAFAQLAQASQKLNRKLAEVAESVTLTGEVPQR
jgi:GAF domain-containing protein